MKTPPVAGLLAERIPGAALLTGDALHRYAISGKLPAVAVRATSPEQVATVLHVAAEHDLAVAPRGGGTMLDLGNPIERLDIVLDLTCLNAVIDYQPDDLTLTVQAGVTVADLMRLLEQRGQSLPLDVPLPETATIGGALAINAHGPRRLRYGTARDLVIGMQAALVPDGLTRSGGKVVKNVAGYDLAKLHIGGLGTTGVITEVTFKLWPAPAETAGVVAGFASLEAAQAAAMQIIHSQLFPAAVEIVSPLGGDGLPGGTPAARGHWQLFALLLGVPAAVARQQREMGAICVTAGAANATALDRGSAERLLAYIRDFGRGTGSHAEVILRIAVLSSQTATAAQLAMDSAKPGDPPVLILRPGTGTVLAYWRSAPAPTIGETVAHLRHALQPMAGTVVVERCPAETAAAIDAWGIEGRDVALMRRLKLTYDPNSTLNPGRFAGRL